MDVQVAYNFLILQLGQQGTFYYMSPGLSEDICKVEIGGHS